jgi:hypothetical protein
MQVEYDPMTAPVTLFYSYSHRDEDLRNELDGHLKILERRGMVQAWYDRKIVPGQARDQEIDERLRNAELVLLLVSKDFVRPTTYGGLSWLSRRSGTGVARRAWCRFSFARWASNPTMRRS